MLRLSIEYILVPYNDDIDCLRGQRIDRAGKVKTGFAGLSLIPLIL